MTVHYTIEIAYGSNFVTEQDRYRAEAAIDAAMLREGITTDEEFKEALTAFIARSECEDHNATLAAKYERIQQSGDAALTLGWHNPDGASLSLGAAA